MNIARTEIVTASAAAYRAGQRDTAGGCHDAGTCRTCRANAAEARRIADGLDRLLHDCTGLPRAIRTVAAARLFSEGNGYLPGQIVDRTA